MVWFQCEDCGDNLKKPKLIGHFRCCSANKLSCIDCGEIFGQQSVQGHTQCMTEMEKYGPKGQNKPASNGSSTPKPNSDSKLKPDYDINVGLSNWPPWFCSLCNTNATSKQTLLLHAEGKKHRAKARAFHASKQPPKPIEEESTPNTQVPIENNKKDENKQVEESKEPQPPKVSEAENGKSKKRKLDGESDGGEVIQVEKEENKGRKKGKNSVTKEDDGEKKIKWKKLITSALKSNPEGVLKMRKLRKLVLKNLKESGFTQDEAQLSEMLEGKINSSSKFFVDGKYVRLVAKS